MKSKIKKFLFLFLLGLTIGVFLFAGTTNPIGQLSLGLFFSTLIWSRSEEQPEAKWLALAVIWSGMILALLWRFFQ